MSSPATQHGTGAYAQVNGLRMYYEIHGTGTPQDSTLIKATVATINKFLNESITT